VRSILSYGSPFDSGIYTGSGCGSKSRKLKQQWLTPNALLKGLACLEGLPLSAGGAHRKRALHSAYQLNQALARNILIFEPQMRLGTRLMMSTRREKSMFTMYRQKIMLLIYLLKHFLFLSMSGLQVCWALGKNNV
jgi:hypothetical protein